MSAHSCLKLQCLAQRSMSDSGRAHRALDDCLVLRQVVVSVAESIGISVKELLAHFALELDLECSTLQIRILMEIIAFHIQKHICMQFVIIVFNISS